MSFPPLDSLTSGSCLGSGTSGVFDESVGVGETLGRAGAGFWTGDGVGAAAPLVVAAPLVWMAPLVVALPLGGAPHSPRHVQSRRGENERHESEAGDEAPVHDEVSGVPAECVLGAIDGAQHHCGRVAAKRQEHRREHHSARKWHRGGENPLVSGPALPIQQGRDAIDGVRARLAVVAHVVKHNCEAFARLHLLSIQGARCEGGRA